MVVKLHQMRGRSQYAYRVSGVRSGEDLSSFNSSCSARRQNSSSRPSGCPFCSQSLYALAAISLSLGFAINVSPTMGPPKGLGALAKLLDETGRGFNAALGS